MKTIKIESSIINFLKGKKTYIVGILAVAYGWEFKDVNAIFIGLGLLGIRVGIAEEIAKELVKAQSTQSAVKAAETVVTEVAAQQVTQ